jgi:YggT family protein
VVILLVFVKIVLSYFMDPYHPVRQTIDSIVEPMLAPIRRIIPPIGMIDFSPLVLIIVIQVVGRILINFLISLG